jgi:hypothetical protein
MCKKLLVATIAVVIGLVVVTKTPVGSLVHGWWSDFTAYCKAEKQAREAKIPPEERIRQLRVEIGKIKGEVQKAVDNLVKMKLDVQDLESGLPPLEKRRNASETDLQAMTVALEAATNQVSFENRTYAKDSFKLKVIDATQRLNTAKATLEGRRKTVESKKIAVDALDKQIRKMQEKELELNVLADNLEAKVQELKLKQMENSVAVDNSKVSECEALAKQIERLLKEENLKAEEYVKWGLTNAPAETPREDVKTDEEVLKAAREALGRGESKAKN